MALRKNFNAGSVFTGSHPGYFLELTAEIVYGCVAKSICNLSKIHIFITDQLFGSIYFYLTEIIYNAAVILFTEKLLQLRPADQIVTADLFYG